MDEQRFDHLARALGAAASRRGILAALAGLAVVRPSAAAKPDTSRRRGVNRWDKQERPDKPDKPDASDGPGTPDKAVICHKPGTPAERTLRVAAAAVAAHLRHGDRRGDCCDAARGFARCGGACCPPPPQGGAAACCPDGSCGCAGACCAGACFLDDLGGAAPAVEFCCRGPEDEVCPTPQGTDTCCPADEVRCACAGPGGIAGSYRRPGR